MLSNSSSIVQLVSLVTNRSSTGTFITVSTVVHALNEDNRCGVTRLLALCRIELPITGPIDISDSLELTTGSITLKLDICTLRLRSIRNLLLLVSLTVRIFLVRMSIGAFHSFVDVVARHRNRGLASLRKNTSLLLALLSHSLMNSGRDTVKHVLHCLFRFGWLFHSLQRRQSVSKLITVVSVRCLFLAILVGRIDSCNRSLRKSEKEPTLLSLIVAISDHRSTLLFTITLVGMDIGSRHGKTFRIEILTGFKTVISEFFRHCRWII